MVNVELWTAMTCTKDLTNVTLCGRKQELMMLADGKLIAVPIHKEFTNNYYGLNFSQKTLCGSLRQLKIIHLQATHGSMELCPGLTHRTWWHRVASNGMEFSL